MREMRLAEMETVSPIGVERPGAARTFRKVVPLPTEVPFWE